MIRYIKRIIGSNFFWGIFSQISQFSVGIILLLLLLNRVSSEEIGIYYIFTSLNLLIYQFNIGFQPTILRNISFVFAGAKKITKTSYDNTETYTDGIDYKLLKQLVVTSRFIFHSIALLVFLLIVIPGMIYIGFLAKDLPNSNDIILAWAVYSISSVLEIAFYYFAPLMIGSGRIKENYQIIIVAKLFFLLTGIFGIVYYNLGLIAVALSRFLSIIVLTTTYRFKAFDKIFVKNTRNINVSFNEIKYYFKILFHNSYRTGLVSFGEYLINNIPLLIAPLFLSLEATGSYGLFFNLISVLLLTGLIIFYNNLPFFSQKWFTNEFEWLRKKIALVFVVFTIIFWLGLSSIVIIGPILLKMMDSNTNLPSIIFMLVLGSIYYFQVLYIISYRFINTKNTIPQLKAVLFTVLILFLTQITLFKFSDFGIWSIPIALFFANSMYNNWKWPKELLLELKISIKNIMVYGFNELKLFVKI